MTTDKKAPLTKCTTGGTKDTIPPAEGASRYLHEEPEMHALSAAFQKKSLPPLDFIYDKTTEDAHDSLVVIMRVMFRWTDEQRWDACDWLLSGMDVTRMSLAASCGLLRMTCHFSAHLPNWQQALQRACAHAEAVDLGSSQRIFMGLI